MRIQSLIEDLETWVPPHLAESWDATGLQVGNPEGTCKAVLLCLDISEAVLEEALRYEISLILSHHPLIFTPLKSLDLRSQTGRLIKTCLDNNLTVYSLHTNLDRAEGGMNDYVAGLLGMKEVTVLPSSPSAQDTFKLVTFVPPKSRDILLEALFQAGGGRVEGYKRCSFSCAGKGTFLPGKTTSPSIGKRGTLNQVEEDRVEVVFSASTLQKGINALKSVHPYEVPAFDIYPLHSPNPGPGYVRVGVLDPPLPWDNFLGKIGQVLRISDFRIAGDPPAQVSRVALCTGSGASFMEQAASAADVYITGDVRYHEAQKALSLRLTLIDPGHFALERIFVDLMASWFERTGLTPTLKIFKSKAEKDPFRFFHVGGNN